MVQKCIDLTHVLGVCRKFENFVLSLDVHFSSFALRRGATNNVQYLMSTSSHLVLASFADRRQDKSAAWPCLCHDCTMVVHHVPLGQVWVSQVFGSPSAARHKEKRGSKRLLCLLLAVWHHDSTVSPKGCAHVFPCAKDIRAQTREMKMGERRCRIEKDAMNAG